MRPFLKVLNSYDGLSCVSASKLKLYLHSYHRYVMSQIKLDSVKLDIKDYYGDMQKVRIQEKPFYESNYNKAKSTYEKAKKVLEKRGKKCINFRNINIYDIEFYCISAFFDCKELC